MNRDFKNMISLCFAFLVVAVSLIYEFNFRPSTRETLPLDYLAGPAWPAYIIAWIPPIGPFLYLILAPLFMVLGWYSVTAMSLNITDLRHKDHRKTIVVYAIIAILLVGLGILFTPGIHGAGID